jgi:hypothetical protein
MTLLTPPTRCSGLTSLKKSYLSGLMLTTQSWMTAKVSAPKFAVLISLVAQSNANFQCCGQSLRLSLVSVGKTAISITTE